MHSGGLTVALVPSRGRNGFHPKSELAAAVALTLRYTDREPSAEIYGAAADRDQSSIVFNVAASMVRANRTLSRRSKIIDSSKRTIVPQAGSFYRAFSADVAGKHGFNSHGVIFDEIHAQRDRRHWEVLTFGAGDARRQPLIFGITTAGFPGERPVAEELHEYADQILRGIIPPCIDQDQEPQGGLTDASVYGAARILFSHALCQIRARDLESVFEKVGIFPRVWLSSWTSTSGSANGHP
jgi:hypothetical protein